MKTSSISDSSPPSGHELRKRKVAELLTKGVETCGSIAELVKSIERRLTLDALEGLEHMPASHFHSESLNSIQRKIIVGSDILVCTLEVLFSEYKGSQDVLLHKIKEKIDEQHSIIEREAKESDERIHKVISDVLDDLFFKGKGKGSHDSDHKPN